MCGEHLPSAVRLGLAVATPAFDRRPGAGHRRAAQCHGTCPAVHRRHEPERSAGRRHARTQAAPRLHARHPGRSGDQRSRRPSATCRPYLDLIEGIAPIVNAWPEVPQIDRASLRRAAARERLDQALGARQPVRPDRPGRARRAAWPARLRTLLRTARAQRAFVNVDMESYHTKDLTLAIFRQVLMEDEFRDTSRRGHRDPVLSAGFGRATCASCAIGPPQRGTPVWVRLVKGAYWDYETVHAEATGWPVPVFREEVAVRRQLRAADAVLLLEHREHLRPALGSHNLRSLAHGIAVARHSGLPTDGFELQMLYGMADAEKQALVDLGHRLRIYMPYGELIPGMAYLVRRLLENTSNDSFLRAEFCRARLARRNC